MPNHITKKITYLFFLVMSVGIVQSQVVINEITPDPGNYDGQGAEWTELYNAGASAVNLGGYVLTDGEEIVVIPNGTLIPAGGYLLIYNSNFFNCATCNWTGWVPGPNTIALNLASCGCTNQSGCHSVTWENQGPGNPNNLSGERVILFDASANIVDAVVYGDGARVNGGAIIPEIQIANSTSSVTLGGQIVGNGSSGPLPASNNYSMPAVGDPVYENMGQNPVGCSSSLARSNNGGGSWIIDNWPTAGLSNTTLDYTVTVRNNTTSSTIYTYTVTNGVQTPATITTSANICSGNVIGVEVVVNNYNMVFDDKDGDANVLVSNGSAVNASGSISVVDGSFSESVSGGTSTLSYTSPAITGAAVLEFKVKENTQSCDITNPNVACGTGFIVGCGGASECFIENMVTLNVIQSIVSVSYTCNNGLVTVTTVPASAFGSYTLTLDNTANNALDKTFTVSSSPFTFALTQGNAADYSLMVTGSQSPSCAPLPTISGGALCVFAPPCPTFADNAACPANTAPFCPGSTLNFGVSATTSTNLPNGGTVEWVQLGDGVTDPYASGNTVIGEQGIMTITQPVYLSQTVPNPTSTDCPAGGANNETVNLTNSTASPITLNGYTITTTGGGGGTFTIPNGTIIPANGTISFGVCPLTAGLPSGTTFLTNSGPNGNATLVNNGTIVNTLTWTTDPGAGNPVNISSAPSTTTLTPSCLSYTIPTSACNSTLRIVPRISPDQTGCIGASSVPSLPTESFVVTCPAATLSGESAVCAGTPTSMPITLANASGCTSLSGNYRVNGGSLVPFGPLTVSGGIATLTGLTTAGTYTLENVSGCPGCNPTVGGSFVIVTAPLPANPTVAAQSVCNGQPTALEATGIGDITWYSDAGLTMSVGSGENLVVNLTAPVTYYVQTVNNDNGCKSAAVPVSIGINNLPTAMASNVSACVGSAINLTGVATPSAPATIASQSWSTNSSNNFTSNMLSPQVTINAALTDAGTYTLYVADNNGCYGTANALVTINALPSFTPMTTQPTCTAAGLITVASITTPPGTYSYVYSTTGTAPFTAMTLNGGNYEIVVPSGAQPATTYTIMVTRTDITPNCPNTATANINIVTGCIPPCPSFSSLSMDNSLCSNGTTVETTNIAVNATNVDAGSSIQLVRFDSYQSNPYTAVGGTVIATGTTGSNTLTATGVSFPATTNSEDYFVYAIITPTPGDAACRPLISSVAIINAGDEMCVAETTGNSPAVDGVLDGFGYTHITEIPFAAPVVGGSSSNSDFIGETANDGVNNGYDVGSNTAFGVLGTDVQQFHVTYDATYLYLVVQGPNVCNDAIDLFIAIDVNNVTGPQVTLPNTAAPFNKRVDFAGWAPEYFVAVERVGGAGDFAALIQAGNTTIASDNVANLNPPNDGTFQYASNCSGTTEVRIPWSSIGGAPSTLTGLPFNFAIYTTANDDGYDVFDSGPGTGNAGAFEEIGDLPFDADRCNGAIDPVTGMADVGCGFAESDNNTGAGNLASAKEPGSDNSNGDFDTIEEYYQITNVGQLDINIPPFSPNFVIACADVTVSLPSNPTVTSAPCPGALNSTQESASAFTWYSGSATAPDKTMAVSASFVTVTIGTSYYWLCYNNGCFEDCERFDVIDDDCFICPTVSAETADYSICSGDNTSDLTSTWANLLVTDGIQYVYFTTPQTGNAMYTGGTVLGNATITSGVATLDNIALPTNATASPIFYYVYAIMNPAASDASCRPSAEIVVTVNPNPIASIVSNNGPICSGNTASFTVMGTAGATLTYNINGGAAMTLLLTGADQMITVPSATTNTTLNITSVATAGTPVCTTPLTATSLVNILSNPTASIVSNNGPICSGNTASFTVMGTAGATLTYNINGGAAMTLLLTGADQMITVPSATANTTLNITSVASAGAPVCTTPLSATSLVNILPNPTASVVSNNGPICSGNTASFTVMGTAGATLTYNINGGAAMTLLLTGADQMITVPSATANTTLNITSVATAGTPVCTTPLTATSLVNILPNPTASIVSNNGPICSGNTASFTLMGTAGATLTYNINGGAAMTLLLTGANQMITVPSATANTTLNITSVAIAGTPVCTTPLTATSLVNILPNPTASIVSNNGPICSGNTASFTVTGTAGATLTYNINGGAAMTLLLTGADQMITVPSATANTTLNITSVATAGTPVCTTPLTATSLVNILSNPTASIVSNNGPICSGNTASFTVMGTAGATLTYNINGGAAMTLLLTGADQMITVPSATANTTLNITSVATAGTPVCTTPLTATSLVNILSNPTASIVSNNGPICSGNTASFTVMGTAGATLTYNINGGVDMTLPLTGANQMITVPSATANTTLNITSVATAGTPVCTTPLTATSLVNILSNPTASIVSNNGPICSGNTASFTVMGTAGATLTYNINGGVDMTLPLTGANQMITVPSATANTTLNMTSVATAGTPVCTTPLTATSLVNILSNPTASISSNNGPICSGNTASFTVMGTTGATLTYNINGGAAMTLLLTGTDQMITVPSATNNTTLNITSVATAGTPVCTTPLTATSLVNILSNPTASIVSNNGPICSGNTASFTVMGTTGATLTYNINGGAAMTLLLTGTDQMITVPSATNNTTLNITSVATAGTPVCTTPLTATSLVNILSNPTASIVSNNGPICSGNTASFTVTGTAGATLTYNINGGAAMTLLLTGADQMITVPSATANTTLNITSVAIAGTPVCTTPLTATSLVNILPNPTASIVSNNGPICSGNTASFTVTGTAGATLTYNINGGAGMTLLLTGADQMITVPSATANTTLNITSVATAGTPVCTTPLTATSLVNILSNPTASIVSNNGPICSGNTASFTVTGTAGATLTYNINGGAAMTLLLTGANQMITVPSATANTTLNMTSVATAGTPVCTTPLAATSLVNILPNPVASIVSNNGPICIGNTASFTVTGTAGATLTYNINGGAGMTLLLTGVNQTITVPSATANTTLNITSVATAGTPVCITALSGEPNTLSTVNVLAVLSVTITKTAGTIRYDACSNPDEVISDITIRMTNTSGQILNNVFLNEIITTPSSSFLGLATYPSSIISNATLVPGFNYSWNGTTNTSLFINDSGVLGIGEFYEVTLSLLFNASLLTSSCIANTTTGGGTWASGGAVCPITTNNNNCVDGCAFPTFSATPVDLTVNSCTSYNAEIQHWLSTFGGASINHQCRTVEIVCNNYCAPHAWQYADNCSQNATLPVSFTVKYTDGSSFTYCAEIIRVDPQTVNFLELPQNLAINCSSPNASAQIQTWLTNNGGSIGQLCGGYLFHTNNYGGGLPSTCNGSGQPVTFTITNECGVSASATAMIMITDNVPPTFTSVPASVTVDCGTATPMLGTATAVDACTPMVSVTFIDVTTGSVCTGVTTIRTFTATDACGNTAIAFQRVTKSADTSAPTFTFVPANTTVACGNNPAFGNATANDGCSSVTVTFIDSNGGSSCASIAKTRIFTATDGCGNTATAAQTITPSGDLEPPTFTFVPTNTEIMCGDAIVYGTPTASDNCGTVTITNNDEVNGNVCIGIMNIRNWTATDACGNTSTAKQVVWQLGDFVDPEFTNQLEDEAVYFCGETPDYDGVGAVDNCGSSVSVSYEIDFDYEDYCYDGYGYYSKVRYTAVDACGNENHETITSHFVPQDHRMAFMYKPQDKTVSCSEAYTFDALHPKVVSYDGAISSVTYTDIANLTPCGNGTVTRRWTATDVMGNTAIAQQVVTILPDTELPTVILANNSIIVSCTTAIPVVQPTVSDNCSSTDELIVTYHDVTIENTVQRIWTVQDACSNVAHATQIYIILDTQAPVFSATLQNKTISCDEPLVFDNMMANDACNTVSMTFIDTQVAINCGVEHTRTWTAADASGNASTIVQKITVVDNTAPIFTFVPANQVVPSADLVIFGTPQVTDNCHIVVLTFTDVETSPLCGNSGFTLTRTWVANDGCNNQTLATQQIGVGVDAQSPIFSTIPVNQSIPFGAPVVFDALTATDNNGAPTLTFQDVQGTPMCGNSGYTITRTWTATDACNNVAIAVQHISVGLDTQAPTFSSTPIDKTIDFGAQVIFDVVTATDNNSTPILTFQDVQGTPICGNSGYTITRTWTATDACDNVAIVLQHISVGLDTQAPTFSYTLIDKTIDFGLPVVFDALTATDNNGTPSLTFQDVQGIPVCGNSGYTITRTWTAMDVCNNVSVATQHISVGVDVEAPTFTSTLSDKTITCSEQIVFETPIAIDNNGTVSITYTDAQSTPICGNTGYTMLRTWTAHDACDNTVQISQTISIEEDTEAPTFIGSVFDIEMTQTAFNAWQPQVPSALDNCQSVQVINSTPTKVDDCNFTIDYTATDACGNFVIRTQNIHISDCLVLGTDEGVLHHSLVYPNPVESKLNIQIDASVPIEHLTAQVFDMLGRVIILNQQVNNHHYIMDVTTLPAGTYTLRLSLDNTSKTVKFVKK